MVHPDCTYHFAFDASLEYDPIVLEELDVLTIIVIPTGSTDRTKHQSYLHPYHVVSVYVCMYKLLLCTYVCSYIIHNNCRL